MNKLIVTAAPHIHENVSTRKLMGKVCIALLPALVASCFIFGIDALFLTAVSAAACVGFEALWNIMMKKEQTIGDLSAVVTGMLVAFNVPAGFPVWMLIIGDLIAIIIVKQLFGGIGYNFANPAIVARIVLALSFTSEMTTYRFPAAKIDALASATPLAAQMYSTPVTELLLGTHGGVLGETCAIALLLGGLYLILSGTISAMIPVSSLATVAVMCLVCGRGDDILLHLLGGGLLLGVFFMATDYVTSPYTRWGKLVYGIGIGVITSLIRFYGTATEGMSYAILLMNIVTPYINRGIRQRPLGVKRQRRKKEGKPA